MNYNNFASRISTPRAIPSSHLPAPTREPAKKPRKPTRRRLSTAAAVLLFSPFLLPGARAQSADLPPSFPESAPAIIAGENLGPAALSDLRSPLSNLHPLSPVTAAFLAIGLTIALFQARLLLSDRELEC
jgi:hypothetical protein